GDGCCAYPREDGPRATRVERTPTNGATGRTEHSASSLILLLRPVRKPQYASVQAGTESLDGHANSGDLTRAGAESLGGDAHLAKHGDVEVGKAWHPAAAGRRRS